MSVLINMEMPTSCGDCKAFVCYRQWAGDSGDCFCGITKSDVKVGVRNADCPLIPVPPHGRLIDGDKLNGYLKISAIMAYGEAKEAYIDARAEAQTMPTIIPAEEGE